MRLKNIVLAAAAAVVLATSAIVAPALIGRAEAVEPAKLNDEAMAALKAWWGAAVESTPTAFSEVLAPEFQIMRADGSGYDKAGYLASKLPKVAAIPPFSQMTVTAKGDYLIVRYYVTVDETRDGKTVQSHAPRLTVFRQEGGKWLVVAHANFATLEE